MFMSHQTAWPSLDKISSGPTKSGISLTYELFYQTWSNSIATSVNSDFILFSGAGGIKKSGKK